MINVCGHIDPVGISRGFMIPVYTRDLENSLFIFKQRNEFSFGDLVPIDSSDAEKIQYLERPIEIEYPDPNFDIEFNFRDVPYIIFVIDGALVHGTFDEFSHEIKKWLPKLEKYPILYFSVVRVLGLTNQYESAMGVAFTHMARNYSQTVAEDWANTQIYLPTIVKEVRNVVLNAKRRIFDIDLEKTGRTVNVRISVDNDEEIHLSKFSELSNLLRVFERDVICRFQIIKLHEVSSDWHEVDEFKSEVTKATLDEKTTPSFSEINKEPRFENRGKVIPYKFRKVKVIDNHIQIQLEPFHWYAAGIVSTMRFFVVPEKDNFCLIVTSIDPSSWGDIWRLDINLKDVPGALNSCFKVFASNNINILHQESLTENDSDDEGMTIQASFVLDLTEYNNKIDKDHVARNNVGFPNLVPLGLKNTLALECADFLVLEPDKSDWRFTIERMGPYFAHKELRELKKDYFYSDNHLRIPKVDFVKFFGDIDVKADDFSYYAQSDQTNRFIKIFFVETGGNSTNLQNDNSNKSKKDVLVKKLGFPTAFVRVQSFDKRGILNDITELLSRHNISVLSSHLKKDTHKGKQIWNVMIECQTQATLLKGLTQLSNLSDVREVLVKDTHNVEIERVVELSRRHEKLRLQSSLRLDIR